MRTRILLNGYDVDLIDEISMPLNFAIADIRNPEKRNTSFSKTLTIPGTSVNNDLFGMLFDISVDVNSSGSVNSNVPINPNKKADVIILFDENIIFTGYFQLVAIKKSEADYKIEYQCNVFGKLKDLFINIGELLLSDIDLSEFNHILNYPHVVDSLSLKIQKNASDFPFTLGVGYVYPMIDFGRNNDVNYNITDFLPSVYVKTIVDKIINAAGFQYTSTFFDSVEFSKLIIPFGGGQLTLVETAVNERTFKATNTSTQTATIDGAVTSTVIDFQDDSTGTNHDAGNNYSIVTNQFTVPYSAQHKVNFNVSASIKHYPAGATGTVSATPKKLGTMYIFNLGSTGITTIIGSHDIYASSSGLAADSLNIITASTITSGTISSTFTGQLSTGNVTIYGGDKIYVVFNSASSALDLYGGLVPAWGGTGYTELNFVTGCSFEAFLQNPQIAEGDIVNMNQVLPTKIKQKDFLSSIFKMFNIYIEQSKQTQNLLIIEPRNDFYPNTTINDWTYKLDLSKDIEILPMGELDARTYLYQFKKDEDYFNKFYQDRWTENYARLRYDIDNDFINAEKITETIFSATPLADRNGTDRVIPRIYQVDSTGTISAKTGNIRIIYYGGIKETLFPYNIIQVSGTTVATHYGYCGHLDDVENPTYDLNFGVPKEVFYTATKYTDNNLFNRFWRVFIDEITGINSKIVSAYFHLNSSDIETLTFQDTFYFEGENFRLNKIIDYDAAQNVPTKCEFIRILNGVPFSPTVADTNGSGWTVFNGYDEILPQNVQRIGVNNNGANSNGSINRGDNNVIDPSAVGAMVIGNNNFIGSMCRNVSFINTSGCTAAPNTTNITAVNCQNTIFDSRYSNQTIVNNIIYGFANIVRKTAGYKSTAADLNKLVIMDITNNATLDLPALLTIANGWRIEIKCVNATGKKVVVTIIDGALMENGSGHDDLNAYHSAVYTYRNSVWYITAIT